MTIKITPEEAAKLYGATDETRERIASAVRRGNVSDLRELLKFVDPGFTPLSDRDAEQAVSICDPRYPELLREIYAPPLVLFVKGELAFKKSPLIAIVGARKAGHRITGLVRRLARAIAERTVTVVSGLAYGVDAAAHYGALDAKEGKTIAVLGTPLNKIYPATHQGLAEQIVASGGALVTEYPSCARVFPSNFLARNRIIAGMCNGVVVAQAGEKSGSLATARFALEENRDVMALPGDSLDEEFAGSNKLIREGATLVTNAEQVLMNFEDELPKSPTAKNETATVIPDWMKELSHEPLPVEVFMQNIPQSFDPHEIMINLELAGVIARLPGDLVQRVY